MEKDSQFWSIAVFAPIKSLLTYSFSGELKPGQTVAVPLGKRKSLGIVIRKAEPPGSDISVKAIAEIVESLVIEDAYLKWAEWLASYYVYPLGLVLQTLFAPLEQRTEKTRKSKKSALYEIPKDAEILRELTPDQAQVLNFFESPERFQFGVHLLHGVTGSGKTEVYLKLLDQVLKSGKSGLFLVPEISLTPQLVHRFAARFGDNIAVLHSHLTERERTDQWWSIVNGQKKILIGARSALFCPMQDLGLIILDEEHEPSYKQDEKFRYHARDAAIMLAQNKNCAVILGSATPSLESWQNAKSGKFHLHRMPSRVMDRAMPETRIINLRGLKDPTWIHPELFEAITEHLNRKEQVALFLNRRGSASLLICPLCGFTYECPNCDIRLTLHGQNHLVCHYCDFQTHSRGACPTCKEGEMKAIGIGTEQIETELQKLFPEARIARADRDEIRTREDMEDLIQRMERQEIDILVGTQMIAKGLDFENLTLVGLVLADIGFNLPDFRATERSFQLITQMSGRTGRHKPGRVIVQTFNPEHPSIAFGVNADFVGFAEQELMARTELHYPPLGRLALFRIQALDAEKTKATAKALVQRAQAYLKAKNLLHDIEILGPSVAPISKLRGKYRYQVLCKSRANRRLSGFATEVLGDEKWIHAGVRVSVDVDPISLL